MKRSLSTTLAAAVALTSISSLSAQARDYSYDFEGDTAGIALTDSATFNYTNNNNSTVLAAGGTLVFRGNSGSSDYEVVSIGGSNALRIQGALNTQTDDFGIYLGGLDFSDFVGGESKTVSFSFDILGNALTSAADWEVNYTLAASGAGHSGFVDDLFTGNTVFTFANTGGTLSTITGSFVVADGVGSTLGGLFISGPRAIGGGAALTGAGGSLALDNLSVNVIPEPQAFAMIVGLLSLGFVALRRR